MKLLAIDGNSIVNRAFYGIKLLTTKDGHFTNGIYGFINILNRLIELEKPDAVAVAFDLHAPTFRHKKYAEYKSGRKGMPEELREQMPVLKEWLNLAGYKYIEAEGFEADDILGTLSAAAEQSNNECVIATGDRDALQLVSDCTRVLLTSTKQGRPELTDYTPELIFQKYGLSVDKLIDLKGLMGDSSDKIPGVAGIGEKTATGLLQSYGSIDNIYKNLASLEISEAVRSKLSCGKESAYLSRWLGTINREAPIDTDFSHYVKGDGNRTELARLMTRLEFFKLMDSMGLQPAALAEGSAQSSLKRLKAISPASFKSENQVDLVAFFEDKLIYAASGSSLCAFSAEDITAIKPILENPDIAKRIYDYKNFFKWCRLRGIAVKGIAFDSMLAGYLASPSASSYDIERLAAEYSATQPEIEGDSSDKAALAALHSEVCSLLHKYLEQAEQLRLLTDIEIPLAEVLAEMELDGFLIDAAGITEYGNTLEGKIRALEKQVWDSVGYEFNLNSPAQLGIALFEKLGLPCKKKTKRGYSTSADVLEELKPLHPAVEMLLEYRSLAKLKSTYCDGLTAAVQADGRIRSTFNQTETRTGRISSLEPNLQNIPVRTPQGQVLRKYFMADEGYVLCDADYSQIELRVLAHIANEDNMISAFLSGEDFHTLAAANAFDMPVDMVTPQLRSRAKAINFGIVYGIGAFSLAKDIGVTRKEAQQFMDAYLAAYPKIDKYMKTVIEQAKADGYVTTVFGRRRYLPELSSSNGMIRAFGERVARNAPIQGAAADIIKIAMIRVRNRLKAEQLDARLILQIHDELIVECKKGIAKKVCEILEEEMTGAATLSVPLTVDAHFGKTWFEAKQ